MSATDEFRRLLEHAAALLDKTEPDARSALADAVTAGSNGYTRAAALAKHAEFVASITYTRLVLELTAKFLDDGSPQGEPKESGS
jgi:hypothetical protein